ncbi:DsbA family oxidoreductase [Knoellia sp. CPCC 206450]|uniref:DsbA family oxidoreductase n=1 Tax=Knoellia tibetensis TaxID=3404798 RepID=UPI003B435315
MAELVLDLWGDVRDPWSHVAKRRVEAAVSASTHPMDVVVLHHVLAGPPVSDATLEEASIAGRPDGIDVTVTSPPEADPADAHRLVALALELGGPPLQAAMLERLYAAVFTEAVDVADPRVLQPLAAEAGLDERRVAAVLASSDHAADLVSDETAARSLGIETTPHLVVDHRVGLGGPASVEDYLALIDRALEDAELPSGGASAE